MPYCTENVTLIDPGALQMAEGTRHRRDKGSHLFFVGEMQQFVYNGNHYFDLAMEKSMENIDVTAR